VGLVCVAVIGREDAMCGPALGRLTFTHVRLLPRRLRRPAVRAGHHVSAIPADVVACVATVRDHPIRLQADATQPAGHDGKLPGANAQSNSREIRCGHDSHLQRTSRSRRGRRMSASQPGIVVGSTTAGLTL
jgi:hypothetical protein